MNTLSQELLNRYWQYALWLAVFTIGYNLLEGLVSVTSASRTRPCRFSASA